MKNHHHASPIHHPHPAVVSAPLHEDIAQRAYALWVEFGCPSDRTVAIWLEAESQLVAVQR